jgi:lambda family phage tail tape measure protein
MASNIRVVLEVDNKKYITDIKRAEDVTNKFAKNTASSLGAINPKLAELAGKFAGFAASIAALGLAAAVNNAIKFADSIQDITDATGIATANVLGFSNAVALNGGSAEGAQKAILKLANSIGEAAEGSKTAQMAFIRAGVSLSDLGKLSEQDILAKTIEGLAKITDSSKRVALAQQLLGKEFRAVNLTGVAAGYSSAVVEAQKYTDSIRKAAEVQNKLDIAFQKIQLSILKAIEPLAEFVEKLTPEQIDSMAKGLVNMATALTAIAGAVVALRGFVIAFAAIAGVLVTAKVGMATLGGATTTLAASFTSLSRTAQFAYGYIDRFRRGTGMFKAENGATTNLSTLFGKLGERGKFLSAGLGGIGRALGLAAAGLVRLIPFIGTAILAFQALDAALELITGRDLGAWFDSAAQGLENLVRSNLPALANALDALGEKLGMAPSPSAQKENADEIKRLQARAEAVKLSVTAEEQRGKKLREVQTDLAKFSKTQEDILESYQMANDAVVQRLAFERQLIGLTDNEKEAQIAREEVLNRQRGIIQDLIKEQGKLRLDIGTDPTAEGKIAAISNVILQIQRTTGLAQDQIEAYTRANQAAQSVERQRLLILQQVIDLENLRAQVLGYSLTELEKFNQALVNSPDFANKTQKEIDLLREQAITRDRLAGAFTAERIARETNTALLDLETQLLGTQFGAVQKLEQLKLANPDAFARKTADEVAALSAQAVKIDEVTAKFRAQAFARDLLNQGQDFAQGIKDEMNLQLATGEAVRRRIQVEIDGRNSLQAKVREINQAYGDEKNLSESLRQQRAREIADAVAGIDTLTAKKAQAVADDQAQRDSFAFGWEAAYGKFAEDAQNAAGQATTYFNTFSKGFEDAFVKFVQTGKISFKDLANSIIADFARIQAKKALAGLFGGGGGGGAGGILGSLGSFFGGFFADGGNPPMGKMSIVGERGPEAFIPRNAGTIVPLQNMGGGNNTAVTYNIQAVDAASFQQLVARDPKFLHAVVEKGRRSLPQGAR